MRIDLVSMIRHIFGAFLALTWLAHPALAQTGSAKIPSVLNAEINSLWPDNTAGAITPFNARQTLLDVVASGLGNTVPGPLASGYVPIGNYTGGVGNSPIFSFRGTIASPIIDAGATAVFQSVGNQAVNIYGGTTLYASWDKRNTTNNSGGRAGFFEVRDNVGGTGSFGEGIRGISSCIGGTGGNCQGVVAVGIATVAYSYVNGIEGQAWNNFADATTSFSASSFSNPVLSSCSGTKKCDAAFLINSNGTVADIYGFLAPSGTIDSTGSVLASLGTSAHGINFNSATCSTDCWLGPSGTSKIDGSGNITGLALAAGAASGIFWTGRSAMSSPSDGIILLSNDAVTGFTRLQLGGTTASFPAIKRNATALNFRLADDSADAPITSAALTASGLVSSTLGEQVTGAGLQIGSPTGGDKGAGTLNISGAVWANGTVGATCTVNIPAHLTVVGGVVTLCN